MEERLAGYSCILFPTMGGFHHCGYSRQKRVSQLDHTSWTWPNIFHRRKKVEGQQVIGDSASADDSSPDQEPVYVHQDLDAK